MVQALALRLYAAASASIADVITGETITWTEITDFVLFAQGVSAQRGRAAEAESTSAGSLSFAVKTKPDGSKASLSFGTPVRLGWDDGVQVHDVWLGSVAEIRQGWAGGVRGVQQVSCTDAVTALERVKLEAWPVQVAKSLGVGIDWLLPLDDDTTERPPRDVSGSVRPPQLQARPVGVPADNTSLVMGQGTSPGSPAGDAESSVATFPAWFGGGWAWVDDAAPRLSLSAANDFTLSCYLKVSESNPTSGDMVAVSTRNWLGAAGSRYVDIGIDTAGKPYAQWTQAGGVTARLEASTPVALNSWHHVALTSDESGSAFSDARLWVDGTQVDAVADFGGPIPFGGLSIGASIESGKRAFAGQVSTVCLFADDLNSTDIGKLAAVTGGYVGESTAFRFNRLLTLAGLPSGGLISDSHRGTMGFQSIKGKSLAELLNEVSRVEHAPWFVRRDGQVVLASRSERWNLTAADIDLPASTVDPSTAITESVRGMVNVLTVSRQGGFTATLRDADSIAAYGEIDGSVSWAAGSDAEAETYAAAMLERESQPTQDTDSLTVDVTASQASLTLLDVCRAEVGEVIEVTGLPADAPASTQQFFVEGVSDRMSPSGWQRTFNTSAVPADTSVWVLGSSDLDTETRLGL